MKTVVAGALGECVHVAGVMNFLRLAETAGWRTVFLGPAVPLETFLKSIDEEKPELVGVSYRLTPETGERLLADFMEAADAASRRGVRFAFGGTPPVAERVRRAGFFEAVFDGSQRTEDVLAYLKGLPAGQAGEASYPQTAAERIRLKSPYPILRHHFGLPSLEDTRRGIEEIAAAKALDVISLGIDQDAQENFFHPERQNPGRRGAGGVPVRSAQDYAALFQASRGGNYPLLRTYSGTDDFIRLAEMYLETINIAWCAIPLFWFNRMDGRGPWDLQGSIREHQQVMAWYGTHNVPVELNEPHHWGMREAPDVVFAAAAFLSAYNARAFGVKDYIAQFMFNSPPGHTDAMDLAKMLAVIELIGPLENEHFRIWRQTRTGLLSYPLDEGEARGQLGASTYLQMALKPHILHVVGPSEAHHAATAADVIEACAIARRVVENAVRGAPDMTTDPLVQKRKEALVAETRITLDAICNLADSDAVDGWTDPPTLARAVSLGVLDAPHLRNNPFAPGAVRTRIVEGACLAVDDAFHPIPEIDRITTILRRNP